MTRQQITIERTGNLRGFRGPVSHEYLVTFPNGSTATIWSPPWNDYSPELEDAGALKAAGEQWFEVCEAWQKMADDAEEAKRARIAGMTPAEALLFMLPGSDATPMRTADVLLAMREMGVEREGMTDLSVGAELAAQALLFRTVHGNEVGGYDNVANWTWCRTMKGDARVARIRKDDGK